MELDKLRETLLGWTSLGPLREIEDLRAEMQRFARSLTAGDAPALADALARLDREDPDLAGVLVDVLDEYIPLHREAAADALLAALADDGPPQLVEALGTAGARAAVPRLRALVDARPGDVALGVSAACALGMIGGDEAAEALRAIVARGDLDEDIRREAELGLATAAPGRA